MERDEQARYGVALEAAAAELRRLLAGDGESTQPVAPDRAIGRLTRVGAMQAQQMSLAGRLRQQQRLVRIEHALERVRQGTYGSCTRCGEDIEPARLDAIPDTFVCMPCMWSLTVARPWQALVYGGLLGLTNGFGHTLQSIVWPDYFGRRNLGSIRSIAIASPIASAAIGPLPFGWLFDVTGSYRLGIGVFLLLPAIAAAAAAVATPPRR